MHIFRLPRLGKKKASRKVAQRASNTQNFATCPNCERRFHPQTFTCPTCQSLLNGPSSHCRHGAPHLVAPTSGTTRVLLHPLLKSKLGLLVLFYGLMLLIDTTFF